MLSAQSTKTTKFTKNSRTSHSRQASQSNRASPTHPILIIRSTDPTKISPAERPDQQRLGSQQRPPKGIQSPVLRYLKNGIDAGHWRNADADGVLIGPLAATPTSSAWLNRKSPSEGTAAHKIPRLLNCAAAGSPISFAKPDDKGSSPVPRIPGWQSIPAHFNLLPHVPSAHT